MREIPDDPIIRWMERTGYPPWYRETDFEDEDFDEEGDDDERCD